LSLSPRHRRFLVLEHGIGSAVFNFFLNLGIAWLLFREAASVPLWGAQSIAGDTIGTAFMLPFFTALIVTRIVGSQVHSGALPSLLPEASSSSAWAARSSSARGAALGVASVVLAALPLVLVWTLAGPSSLELGGFLFFKATFAALLAAAVTPAIAWWALVAASRARG
jgi:hypothetical protein